MVSIDSLWASYQIREIAGCACAVNAGNVFPCRRFQRKPLDSDPCMHHGTCVTHVPWCMSGSLTCGDRENVPGIPGACAPAILRIWQEAHWDVPCRALLDILLHVENNCTPWTWPRQYKNVDNIYRCKVQVTFQFYGLFICLQVLNFQIKLHLLSTVLLSGFQSSLGALQFFK